jgi:hypothetical protein
LRPEIEVYQATIADLEADGWHIICASPPGGTDLRYRRCLLPRPDPLRPERGLRDEVDITATRNDIVVLIECKSLMSESLLALNNLGESDYVKLKRLVESHPPAQLSALLRQGTGTPHVVDVPTVEIALAVSALDMPAPHDVGVFLVTDTVAFRPAQGAP